MAEIDPSTPERLRALESRWLADKTSRVFVQLAEEYRRIGRAPEALEILAEGLLANPNYLAAHVVLGRCHLDLGHAREAIRELEAVIARDPTQMVAYKLLVEAHLIEGDGEEARKRLRIYSLLNDSDPEIADLRRRIGEAGRSRRDPDDTSVGALHAESAAAAPRPAVDFAVFESAAAEPPVETPAVFDALPFPDLTVDPARYRAGLQADAIFDLELPDLEPPAVEPVATDPGTPAPRDIPWRFEEAAPAVFELEDAPAADLDVTGLLNRVAAPAATAEPAADLGATATLGRLYLRQGHLDEAEAMFRQVLEREPDHAAAHEGLADIEALRSPAASAEPDQPDGPEDAPAEPTELDAAGLLIGFDPAHDGTGGSDRRRFLLRSYLERLRAGRGSNVR